MLVKSMKINFKTMRKYIGFNLGATIVASILLLVVGTFVAWKIGSYLSDLKSGSGPGATVKLGITDNSGVACTPLPNNLTDSTPGEYNSACATVFKVSGGQITLPRLQGQILYKKFGN